MLYFWVTLLLILNANWLVLLLFQLPGNWLMVISTFAFAWWQGDKVVFSTPVLVIIVLLALLGEIIEFFAGAGGAKKAGAGWIGSIGALAGAIVGAIFGTFFLPIPLFGTLIGSCIGAGCGAFSLEMIFGKEKVKAVHFGKGAAIGVLIGTSCKIGLGIMIWFIIAIAAFWP